VVDGFSPKGVEGEIRWRKDFLRRIGYKLCWKRQARLAPFTAAVILTGGHVFIKRRITDLWDKDHLANWSSSNTSTKPVSHW
jgi:hypothetical protein